MTAGDYTVYAKSGNCTDTRTVTVTAATAISLVDIQPQIPDCADGTDGQLTIMVSGGNAPYQYKLDDGVYQTNNTFFGLRQGIYTIIVRDDNGCEQPFTDISLAGPTTLVANCSTIQNVTTKDGSDGIANVFVSGGTPPYNIQLVLSLIHI